MALFCVQCGGVSSGLICDRCMYDEYKEGYLKIDKLVLKLASLYPEDVKGFQGTVADRLSYLIDKVASERIMWEALRDTIRNEKSSE